MAALEFNESLVRILDSEELDTYAVEEELANVLLQAGYVKESYPAALHEREEGFPTALEVPGGISAAVPHCDPEHVNRGGMCMGVLKHPISWRRMDAPDETCEVSLVVMLALDEPHAHLEMLQKVIGLIQDQELVARVIGAATAAEAYELVKDSLA